MANINNIDSLTLKDWLDNDEAVLIDVREVIEYKTCSIPNSRHLPLSDININKAHLPEYKDKKLVLHCKSSKRSMMACEKLIKEGIKFDIWNLEGGIESWKDNNLPTISEKNTLPLERQTQIAISTLILSGLSLYYFLENPIYLILPLAAGLGLLNAGITGWCGMAKFIAKMPWNK
jgi:rhodanese-related sulfurtransferase